MPPKTKTVLKKVKKLAPAKKIRYDEKKAESFREKGNYLLLKESGPSERRGSSALSTLESEDKANEVYVPKLNVAGDIDFLREVLSKSNIDLDDHMENSFTIDGREGSMSIDSPEGKKMIAKYKKNIKGSLDITEEVSYSLDNIVTLVDNYGRKGPSVDDMEKAIPRETSSRRQTLNARINNLNVGRFLKLKNFSTTGIATSSEFKSGSNHYHTFGPKKMFVEGGKNTHVLMADNLDDVEAFAQLYAEQNEEKYYDMIIQSWENESSPKKNRSKKINTITSPGKKKNLKVVVKKKKQTIKSGSGSGGSRSSEGTPKKTILKGAKNRPSPTKSKISRRAPTKNNPASSGSREESSDDQPLSKRSTSKAKKVSSEDEEDEEDEEDDNRTSSKRTSSKRTSSNLPPVDPDDGEEDSEGSR